MSQNASENKRSDGQTKIRRTSPYRNCPSPIRILGQPVFDFLPNLAAHWLHHGVVGAVLLDRWPGDIIESRLGGADGFVGHFPATGSNAGMGLPGVRRASLQ